MTNQVVVTVNFFGKESLDKNGKQAVILLPVAGKMPNRNILAGTTAERAGFKVGKSYLATVREIEKSDIYGRQFQWTAIAEITNPLDIIKATRELGEGTIFEVEEPVTSSSNQNPSGI